MTWTPSGRHMSQFGPPSQGVDTPEMQTTDADDCILLMEQLASAIREVDEGQERVRRQRDRIYFLGKSGRDTALAELVLVRLESSQLLRVADRQRLEGLLALLAPDRRGRL